MRPTVDHGLHSSVEEVEMEPFDFFIDLGSLVLEGRVPGLSGKGYGEGVHCPPALVGQARHQCNPALQECQRFDAVVKHMTLLWKNGIPMSVEVLLFPECCRDNPVGTAVDMSSAPDTSNILLEQWFIHMIPRRVPDATIAPRSLIQAVRSYLHFSQISAWYSQTGGRAPRNVYYRISVPGEAFSSKFHCNPHLHTFPVASLGRNTSIKVSVKSAPRCPGILPILSCPRHFGAGAPHPFFSFATQQSVTNIKKLPPPKSNIVKEVQDERPVSPRQAGDTKKRARSDSGSGSLLGESLLDPPQSLQMYPKRYQSPSRCGSPSVEAPEHLMLSVKGKSSREPELMSSVSHQSRPQRRPVVERFLRKNWEGSEVGGASKQIEGKQQQQGEGSRVPQPVSKPVRTTLPSVESSKIEPIKEPTSASAQESNNIGLKKFKDLSLFDPAVVCCSGPYVKPQQCKDREVQNGNTVCRGKDICDSKNLPCLEALKAGSYRAFKKQLAATTDDVSRTKVENVSSAAEKSHTKPLSHSKTWHEGLCNLRLKDGVVGKGSQIFNNLIHKHRVRQLMCQTCSHSVPTAAERAQFRRSLDSATSMVFHQKTGLPLTSSPAPLRKSGASFDFDSTLTSVSAIKKALFEKEPDGIEYQNTEDLISSSAPASITTSSLVVNFEESVLNGRLEPVSTVQGFVAEIGASGSFCPRHITLPVTVFFYSLHDMDKVVSPYLGHINLGMKGYHVPKAGTIQVTLFNPHNTVVKMFVVRYDLSDMPPNCQTFLRQRTLYMPTDASEQNVEASKWLRYLIHLRFASSKSGRIYLHTDIRIIVFRKSDLDAATIHGAQPYELRSFTQCPVNPKFSPYE
uniref:Atos-like conserved domain-containing protein n=1 Tax=Ornithodoros turicata TaxID=34597 RepID=A0A2R5L3V1_9ACAR